MSLTETVCPVRGPVRSCVRTGRCTYVKGSPPKVRSKQHMCVSTLGSDSEPPPSAPKPTRQKAFELPVQPFLKPKLIARGSAAQADTPPPPRARAQVTDRISFARPEAKFVRTCVGGGFSGIRKRLARGRTEESNTLPFSSMARKLSRRQARNQDGRMQIDVHVNTKSV